MTLPNQEYAEIKKQVIYSYLIAILSDIYIILQNFLNTNNKIGQSRCFGYIVAQNVQSLAKLMNRKGHKILGKKVEFKLAFSKEYPY